MSPLEGVPTALGGTVRSLRIQYAFGSRFKSGGTGIAFPLLFRKYLILKQKGRVMAHPEYQPCIDACTHCAQECEQCAEACLDEPNVQPMVNCIRLDRDCAAICRMAASFMSASSEFIPDVCGLCTEICDACAAECARHEMDHCQRCAEACRACAEQCVVMSGEPA